MEGTISWLTQTESLTQISANQQKPRQVNSSRKALETVERIRFVYGPTKDDEKQLRTELILPINEMRCTWNFYRRGRNGNKVTLVGNGLLQREDKNIWWHVIFAPLPRSSFIEYSDNELFPQCLFCLLTRPSECRWLEPPFIRILSHFTCCCVFSRLNVIKQMIPCNNIKAPNSEEAEAGEA